MIRFAQLAAAVFLNKGFKVYLFSQHTPTPYNVSALYQLPYTNSIAWHTVNTPIQPYCIKVHRAIAGVQVTASHNPKEDNGYKVFWDNGAQVCFNLLAAKLNLAVIYISVCAFNLTF